MQTLSQIKSYLAERGIHPKHRFGQNFLHDQNQLRKLVQSADVKENNLILEIGPGTGTLTEALLEAGAAVIACEIDRDMAEILNSHLLPQYGNEELRIVEADCLASKRSLNGKIIEKINRPFKLVANLPYQITSPLIATLLTNHWNRSESIHCRGIFVTVQREAADRLLAKPRTKDYGPLAILVSILTESERVAKLPPSCFWPEPKVRSSMLAIRPKNDVKEAQILPDIKAFSEFLERCFQTRRKQLGSILRGFHHWPEEIIPTRRPEELSASAWVEMYRRFRTIDE